MIRAIAFGGTLGALSVTAGGAFMLATGSLGAFFAVAVIGLGFTVHEIWRAYLSDREPRDLWKWPVAAAFGIVRVVLIVQDAAEGALKFLRARWRQEVPVQASPPPLHPACRCDVRPLPVPGLDADGGPLEHWERIELERLELFASETAAEPRRQP